MRLPYRSAFHAPSITRLHVKPDDPKAIVGARPRGSRRPHKDASVAEVRRLIEQTVLTYAQIEQKTDVGRASICRWTRDQNWQRPVFAPRATDTIPTARASAHLKRRMLAARLSALAERHVRELEVSACVDPDRLAQALELLKLAKFAAMGRRRRRRNNTPLVPASSPPAVPAQQRDTSSPAAPAPSPPVVPAQQRGTSSPVVPAKAGTHNPGGQESARIDILAELQTAGVDLTRAPAAALRDVIEVHTPPRDFPELRPRGRRSKRNREHASLLEREP